MSKDKKSAQTIHNALTSPTTAGRRTHTSPLRNELFMAPSVDNLEPEELLIKKPRHPDYLKKGAEIPAAMLDHTVSAGIHIKDALPSSRVIQKTSRYWHMLGPGLTTGASDDDPSGILTYSQTGAKYGFNMLWLAPFTFPLMAIVQEMCARIGLVTGRGLAGNIRVHFNKKILYVCTSLLFLANAINIGADLGAMAKAMQLFNPHLPFTVLVIAFAVISLGLQIFTPYARYARYLKWLALVLLSYVFSTVLAHLDWSTVLRHAVVPQIGFDKEQLLLICAILGTTISPYLFFGRHPKKSKSRYYRVKRHCISAKSSPARKTSVACGSMSGRECF